MNEILIEFVIYVEKYGVELRHITSSSSKYIDYIYMHYGSCENAKYIKGDIFEK